MWVGGALPQAVSVELREDLGPQENENHTCQVSRNPGWGFQASGPLGVGCWVLALWWGSLHVPVPQAQWDCVNTKYKQKEQNYKNSGGHPAGTEGERGPCHTPSLDPCCQVDPQSPVSSAWQSLYFPKNKTSLHIQL